jgi:hypothetical protein
MSELRDLPSVEQLANPRLGQPGDKFGRPLTLQAIRSTLKKYAMII